MPRIMACEITTETAILNHESPKCMKDIQKLTRRIAALNMFISKSSEKCKPFYNLLRKNADFEWDEARGQAFQDLKIYLINSPLLISHEKYFIILQKPATRARRNALIIYICDIIKPLGVCQHV